MRLYYTNPTGENSPMTRPDLSLGGFKSSTVCPNNGFSNMFADISVYSVSEGVEEFIALALVNETGLDLYDVTLHFVYPTGCQKSIQVAPVTFNSNREIEVIQTPYSAPYNAVFYEANGETNAINIGSIPVGGQIGLWFKKIIDKTAILNEYSNDNIVLNGNPVQSNEEIHLMVSWGHLPILSTTILTSVTQTTAISGGNIANDGDQDVTVRGVCWSTTPNPTILDDVTTDGIGTGSFISNITGLTGNTLYYVRAYATNSLGTAYGNELELLTSPVLSTVTTTAATSITSTTVVSGGNVTDDGGANVTVKGVCWSTTSNPDVNDNVLVNVLTGEGSFVSNITGLTADTLYYLRAYSENAVGISYGNEISFTTLT